MTTRRAEQSKYQNVDQLIYSIQTITNQFPLPYRQSIGQDARLDCMKLVSAILQMEKDPGNIGALYELEDRIEILGISVKVWRDLGLLSLGTQHALQGMLFAIRDQVCKSRAADQLSRTEKNIRGETKSPDGQARC